MTSDHALADDLKSLRSHGWVRDRSDVAYWKDRCPDIDERFMFVSGGYNVRPTEINAAIGRVQLRKLDGMLAARERLARLVHGWVSRAAPWLRLIGSEHLSLDGASPSRRARGHSWMALPFRLEADLPLGLAPICGFRTIVNAKIGSS